MQERAPCRAGRAGPARCERSSSAGELMAPPATTHVPARRCGSGLPSATLPSDSTGTQWSELTRPCSSTQPLRPGSPPAASPRGPAPRGWSSPASIAWHWSGSPGRRIRGSSSLSRCAGSRRPRCPASARPRRSRSLFSFGGASHGADVQPRSAAANHGASASSVKSVRPKCALPVRQRRRRRAERARPVDGGRAADAAALQDVDRLVRRLARCTFLVERRVGLALELLEVAARLQRPFFHDHHRQARPASAVRP